jgi:hypothetical protein
MFIRHPQQYHRRDFLYTPTLLPVEQGAHADAQHGGELRLGQLLALVDALDIHAIQIETARGFRLTAQDRPHLPWHWQPGLQRMPNSYRDY